MGIYDIHGMFQSLLIKFFNITELTLVWKCLSQYLISVGFEYSWNIEVFSFSSWVYIVAHVFLGITLGTSLSLTWLLKDVLFSSLKTRHPRYIFSPVMSISVWSMRSWWTVLEYYDDITKCKHFPYYWPFVRGLHRWQVNSPHKGQWCGVLMFPLISAWIKNHEVGGLRCHRAHYDFILMYLWQGEITRVIL